MTKKKEQPPTGVTLVDIQHLKANPNNPRVLRDDKFAKLIKSLTDFPEMLTARPIVAVNTDDGLMVLGGNMRLRACQELKLKQVAVYIADHWTEDQRQQFIIKDNVGFGEWDWDQLANEWDAEQLAEWGLDAPGFDVSPIEAPELADGPKPEFQQMTFTLHDTQAETVKAAMERAKAAGASESDVNENSNGNALATFVRRSSMGRAKDIVVKPIAAKDANALVKRLHYSGKVAPNSQLHLGVFMDGKCGGAMQFGPSFDKSKMLGLVEGTEWNGFIELNRMAFAEWLPRNSESRAIGYAFRWMRKQYPHIKWCVSFADGTQCGDGTIYRASGFALTGIRVNRSIIELQGGERVASMTYTKGKHILSQGGRAGIPEGAKHIPGFQLRYIYFLDPTARQRLTVPILPFSEIEKRGAGMYRGKPKTSAGSSSVEHPTSGGEAGGSIPTPALNVSSV